MKEKERRCLACNKKLIDGFVPICPRCKLKGTGTLKKGGKFVAGAAAVVVTTAIASNGKKEKDSTKNQTDNGNSAGEKS